MEQDFLSPRKMIERLAVLDSWSTHSFDPLEKYFSSTDTSRNQRLKASSEAKVEAQSLKKKTPKANASAAKLCLTVLSWTLEKQLRTCN